MDGGPGAPEGAGAGAGVGAVSGSGVGVGNFRPSDMALFPSSSRPRTLMEQLLARKIEAAAAASGAPSASVSASSPAASGSATSTTSPTSPTSPMLPPPAGVGAVGLGLGLGLGMGVVSRLRRTDSLDSTSSLGSLAFGEDVCRCDDCLLGIVDLYVISAAEAAKKKVSVLPEMAFYLLKILAGNRRLLCPKVCEFKFKELTYLWFLKHFLKFIWFFCTLDTPLICNIILQKKTRPSKKENSQRERRLHTSRILL